MQPTVGHYSKTASLTYQLYVGYVKCLVKIYHGGEGYGLLISFFQFSDEYIPTKYSKDHKEIEVRGRLCKVEILDTAGLSQYWGMRDNMIRQG